MPYFGIEHTLSMTNLLLSDELNEPDLNKITVNDYECEEPVII